MNIKTVLLLLNGVVIPYTQTETVSELNNYLNLNHYFLEKMNTNYAVDPVLLSISHLVSLAVRE